MVGGGGGGRGVGMFLDAFFCILKISPLLWAMRSGVRGHFFSEGGWGVGKDGVRWGGVCFWIHFDLHVGV